MRARGTGADDGRPRTAPPDDLPPAPRFDALRRVTAAFPELSGAAVTAEPVTAEPVTAEPVTAEAPASEALAAELAARSGIDAASLPGLLQRHAGELVYLLGENPELAGALLTPGRAVLGPAGAGPAPARWPGMSRQLTAALVGR